MEIYHEIDDERGHAWTHQNLAWVAFQSGDYDDAEVQLVEAHERFEELGDRNGVSWAAGLQAWVSYFQRRFDEAEELALSVGVDVAALGRHVADADDADAARQPAPVDRTGRRGRAVGRAGAQRVP